MTIVDRYVIQGRGTVVIIDALPAELLPGMHVSCGNRSWNIVGLETHCMAREFTNGRPAGLLLREEPLPEVGDELTLSS